MTGGRDGELLRRVETLEQEMYGVDRKSGVKSKVDDLWSLSKMGKGAVWMLLKIGILAATIAGGAAALWRAFWGGA